MLFYKQKYREGMGFPRDGRHTLSGTGSQSIRLDFTGEKVIAEGLTGTYTVQYTDAAGMEYPAETVTEAESAEESPTLPAAGEKD